MVDLRTRVADAIHAVARRLGDLGERAAEAIGTLAYRVAPSGWRPKV